MATKTGKKDVKAQPALTEIRWHGRGGQGAVTAAKMVAELALGEGKYFQAFPEYGPERSGAPIVAFTRVSDAPIQVYSGIEHPQIVVVLDSSLLEDRRRHQGRARGRHRARQQRALAGPAAQGLRPQGRPPLHHRRDPHRSRDHQAPHPEHADGRRAHAHHRAVRHR